MAADPAPGAAGSEGGARSVPRSLVGGSVAGGGTGCGAGAAAGGAVSAVVGAGSPSGSEGRQAPPSRVIRRGRRSAATGGRMFLGWFIDLSLARGKLDTGR